MKISEADRWFSYMIRLRDSDDNGYCKCVTCPDILFWRNMDNGHYIKRQHSGTRFNEKNCHAQCRKCNWLLQGNDSFYKEFIIKTYGQETHDLLKSAERGATKHTKLELKLLTSEFKTMVKELAKQKGLTI